MSPHYFIDALGAIPVIAVFIGVFTWSMKQQHDNDDWF